MASFRDVFGFDPEMEASAPGRVNLLGEHTDYNDGYVLPTAIPQRTRVQLAPSRDLWFLFYAADLDELVRYRPGEAIPAGFARYVAGCVEMLRESGCALAPAALHIHSNVPMGAGLSSSAALEVAVLRGFRELFALAMDDVRLALLAQQAEIRYAGVRCGIMDPMAASLGDDRHMLFLDTRTLERRLLPLPAGADVIVLDSGVPRRLADSAYNQRRAECEEAARRLGVAALRDIEDPKELAGLPPPLDRRARHVVSENRRVLQAVAGASASEFGRLMNASHASLRDDFEVSVPELDLLVDLLQKHRAVLGARLTGAGFGGACVALVEGGRSDEVKTDVLGAYAKQGRLGGALV